MTDDERYEAEYKVFVKEPDFNKKADIIRSHSSRAVVFPPYLVARSKFRERLVELQQLPHESPQYKSAFEEAQKSKMALDTAEQKLFGSTNMAEQIYEQSKGRLTDNPLEKATQWGVDVIQNRQRTRDLSPSTVAPENGVTLTGRGIGRGRMAGRFWCRAMTAAPGM